MKTALVPVLLLAGALLPSQGLCGWEQIRRSGAPLAVVNVSTGAYEISYTVGDNCASREALVSSPVSLWSGYLSLVPADAVNQGLASFTSTSSFSSGGGLWGMTQGENLELAFGEEISEAISDPAVSVTQLYNNSGDVSNSSWPVTVAYSGQKLVVVPSDSWPKGSVFSVYFSSSIVDINGSPVSPAATVYFSVIMDHQSDNVAASFADRRVRVSIPANAYSQDFYVAVTTGLQTQEVADANSRLSGLPGSPQFVNAVGFSPYDVSGSTLQPGSACVITLPYPDADGDGVLDGGRLKVSALSVWHLPDGGGTWQRQAGPIIDTAGRTVSQSVPHFSSYALVAAADTDVSYAHPYPVPFRPGAGDAARYGSWATGITFKNLPSEGKVRIYTLTGALVRTLPFSSSTVTWDVKNSDGQRAASGAYIWEVVSGGNRKTGKLLVIK